VIDPNTYAVLHNAAIYTNENGNSVQFFSNNQKYIVAGFDTAFPKFHIYNAATYASMPGGATTTFSSGT
jgi:hypothetical protein